MEAARKDGKTEVETDKMPPGSYRDLSHANVPSGCSAACPCRGEGSDPRDATRRVPICLDPNRFSELVQAERQAHMEARRHRFSALWREAKDTLQSQVREGEGNTLALLLIRPLLLGYGYGARHDYRGDFESWSLLVRQVVQELEIVVPWQTLCDPDAEEADIMSVLQEVPAADVLLLTGCLWLAIEANTAVRFGGETPDLDLVLGRSAGTQTELPGEDPNEDDASAGAMVEAQDDADLATSDELQPADVEWNDPDADEGDEHEWVWNEAGSDTGESASTETAVDPSDPDRDGALAAATADESDAANR
ncbi:MAG TPA: hypothetical protein VNM48_04260 [Chloroflexota bacterium]|nr:hypothetical protein [Chloroflexota bacterium]